MLLTDKGENMKRMITTSNKEENMKRSLDFKSFDKRENTFTTINKEGNMKRIISIIVAVLCFGFTVPAFAVSYTYPSVGDTITISMGPANGYIGEVNVDIIGTSSNPDFISFCVEHNTNIYIGQPYTVLGISNATDSIPPKPISPNTAYLYTMFTNNMLAGNNYTNDEAADLQKAIWFLQGENGGVENSYAVLAENSGWTDIGNVRALNFGPDVQDLLTIQPTPTPEPTTLVLMAIGLGSLGVAAWRRRGQKKDF
jgi:hypothetical protein